MNTKPHIKKRESKKIVLVCVMLLFSMIMMVIVLPLNVHALGIAPSKQFIEYKQDVQKVTARIINNDRIAMRLAVYAKGELANYTTLPDSQIFVKADEAEKNYTYTIKLPTGLHPGTNELDLMVIQLPDTFGSDGEKVVTTDDQTIVVGKKDVTMISATSAMVQKIQVRVPYPDSYIEGNLFVSGGKTGDTLTFSVPLVNRGSKPTKVYADITVKGPTNAEIASFSTETLPVEGNKEIQLNAAWKADINEGMYIAEAIVHFDNQTFVLRKEFQVGNLFVAIDALDVKGFKLGGIAKFDVSVKNKWNQELPDVYGELKILEKDGKEITSLKTIGTTLPPYGQSIVSGYWDTTDVSVGSYDVNVVLHYASKTSEKLFPTVVGIDKITVANVGSGQVTGANAGSSSVVPLLVVLVVVLVIANITWIFIVRRKGKKPPIQQAPLEAPKQ